MRVMSEEKLQKLAEFIKQYARDNNGESPSLADSLRSNCGQTCGQKIFGISGGAEVVGKCSILPRKCKK